MWQRLRRVPSKRCPRPVTEYLEFHELEQVFTQVSLSAPDGHRNLTLLALLYNTGARATEIAGLRLSGLTLDYPPTVRLMGKGRVHRVCPLWTSTTTLLRHYLDHHRRIPLPEARPFVFINQRGRCLTRFGLGRIVSKYLRLAAENCPSLRKKKLSTHSFRHTTAVHLIEAGADVNVTKAWLGHRTVRSTDHYLDINLESHRQLLERLPMPQSLRNLQDFESEASVESPDAIDIWLNQL